MPAITYLNGAFLPVEQAQIPIEERGHQFGDGVYEVVRVYGGRPFLLEWHLERLERSLAVISIDNPLSRDAWLDLISEAIRRSQEAEAIVYWQVTRGIAARSHAFPNTVASISLIVRPVPVVMPQGDPVVLLALPDERWANVFVKSINLLPNVLAKESAHQAGAFEALLVRDGILTEGSSSNVWFVKGGTLYTHPANRYILAGITRRFVFDIAANLGIPVLEQALTLADLNDDVEAVFLTGTNTEVRAVKQVVVHTGNRPNLEQLPANPENVLVYKSDQLEVIWKSNRTDMVDRLQQAYAEAIERFRLYTEPLIRSL